MQLKLTPSIKVLLILSVVFFILQQTVDQFFGGNVIGQLGLVPIGFMTQFKLWQLVTYSFLHGDPTHLILNLLMLVFIGSEIESLWGTKKFLKFYFFCVAVAGVAYLGLQLFVFKPESLHTPMVGASGGIYGLLMAYGLLYGERMLLFMMLFPMKAKHFIWVLAAVEFMTTVFSSRSGVAGIAHLGGMAGGWIYLFAGAWVTVMKERRRLGRSDYGTNSGTFWTQGKDKKKSAGHLRLVVDKDAPERKGTSSDDDPEDPPKIWH